MAMCMCMCEQEGLLAVCITNTGKTTQNCIYVGHKNGIKKLPRLLNACIFRMLWHSIKPSHIVIFFFSSEGWLNTVRALFNDKTFIFSISYAFHFPQIIFSCANCAGFVSSLPIQFTLFAKSRRSFHHAYI